MKKNVSDLEKFRNQVTELKKEFQIKFEKNNFRNA